MSDENKLEETQAVQGSYDNTYANQYALIEKGVFLLKVLDAPTSNETTLLAEKKLQDILSKF
ncbi:hypothetical protein OHW97_01850 [Acinetobacter baumannii]|nr:hypothetical protein [Acinetobacter baumannii]